MDRIGKGEAASLTVEAALVLPVFLFGILFFLYFFQILFLQESVQRGLTETGKFISRYEKIWEKEGADLATKVIVKQYFLKYLDQTSINTSCIVGGALGINLATSQIMEENDEIDMIAIYQIRIFTPFFGKRTALIRQRFTTRAFVGKQMKSQTGDISFGEDSSEECVLVYIAENGGVYHLYENCTHLKLSITKIEGEHLSLARNEKGGKYKPCEKCVRGSEKEEEKGEFYIAKDGDRYHVSLSCSGLKRTVYAVDYSTVKDKGRCKRCG